MGDDVTAVAMSGGVDSSVVAWLATLEEEAVLGVTMVLHDDHWDAVKMAEKVCGYLGIDHEVLDLRDAFQDLVLDDYVKEYELGRTPNPCVHCNERIKFGLLFDGAKNAGATRLRTGHYVGLTRSKEGDWLSLQRPPEGCPDETYFLYRVPRALYPQLGFPLGGKTKAEVRRIAHDAGLPASARPSSQDTCFPSLVPRLLPERRWNVFDTTGEFLGVTRPLSRVTLGQRKGLGLSIGKKAFVVRVEYETAKLILGGEEDLISHSLSAQRVVWAIPAPPRGCISVEAKARYNQIQTPASVDPVSHEEVQVVFNSPQRSLTPGQSVVFYQNRELIGGGVIQHVNPE